MKRCPELVEGSPSYEATPDEIGPLFGLPGLESHGCVSFQLALLPGRTVNGFRERIERIQARIREEKPRRIGNHPFNLFQKIR